MKTNDTYLKASDIVRVLWSRFSIRVFSCNKLPDTSSCVYELSTSRGCLALKEYTTKTSLDAIILEVKICAFLTAKGHIVPRHLLDNYGNSVIPFNNHYFTVYPWIPGSRLPFHSGTPTQILQCAELYGRLVCSLTDFSDYLKRKDAFNKSNDAIDDSIRQHRELLSIIKCGSLRKELQIKVELLHELKEEQWTGFESITWRKSHGDYSSYQILFDGERITGVLDFTSARQMPVIYELLRSFLYIGSGFESGLPDMQGFAEYLMCYEKYESLTLNDILFAVRCYYLRILKTVFGYQQYAMNPKEVGYLCLGQDLYRQCIMIHDNMEELTARLCEEVYG